MIKSCEFCGKQLNSKKDLIKRMIWERDFKVCQDCQDRLDKHICLKCGRKVPEQLIIGGYCESCYNKLVKFRTTKENNNIDLQLMVESSKYKDVSIDDKDNGLWVSGTFSTNKIQMTQFDDSISHKDYKSLVEKLIDESEYSEMHGTIGYASRRYGVQQDNKDQLMLYKEDLENFLEAYSKKLIELAKTDDGIVYSKYSIVFIDEAIENMTLKERINIIGLGSHFFLIENDASQIRNSSKDNENTSLLKSIADQVNLVNKD